MILCTFRMYRSLVPESGFLRFTLQDFKNVSGYQLVEGNRLGNHIDDFIYRIFFQGLYRVT